MTSIFRKLTRRILQISLYSMNVITSGLDKYTVSTGTILAASLHTISSNDASHSQRDTYILLISSCSPTGPNDLATWIADNVFFVSSPFSHRPNTKEPIALEEINPIYVYDNQRAFLTLFFITPLANCRIPPLQNILIYQYVLTPVLTEEMPIEWAGVSSKF